MKRRWYFGKTVIITGASSGIGRLLAKKLTGRYGCKVIGIARTESKLMQVKEELGDSFTYHTFDTGIGENWTKFAKYLEENNIRPDILINNAGILPPFSRFDGDGEEFERVMHINFHSSVYATDALLDMIKKSDTPAIINISSSAALASIGGTSAYTASKCALKSFTEVIALENSDMYIAAVCPGFSRTEIFRSQKFESKKEFNIITKLSSDPDKLTDTMLRKIARKKMRIVVGYDARLTDFFSRLFPVLTIKTIRKILKKYGPVLFKGIYEKKEA